MINGIINKVAAAGICLLAMTAFTGCGGNAGNAASAESTEETSLAAAETTDQSQPEETEEEASEPDGGWYKLDEGGTVLTVHLPANPTTGYVWSYELSDTDILECLTDEYVPDEAGKGMAGVGGVWTASFKPTLKKAGDAAVRLTYGRPWLRQPDYVRTIDITVEKDGRIIVNNASEMEKNTPVAADGTYRVRLDSDRIEKTDYDTRCAADVLKTIVLTDSQIDVLEAGDVIKLSKYGLYDITVEKTAKHGENSIVIDEEHTLIRDDKAGGWVIRGEDDDTSEYVIDTVQLVFPDGLEFEDHMSEVVYEDQGHFETVYDCVSYYGYVTAEVTVEGGVCTAAVINYHP